MVVIKVKGGKGSNEKEFIHESYIYIYIMEAVSRTVEGHQIAVRLVRLKPEASGNPTILPSELLPRTLLDSSGGSPSLPAEAPFGTVHLGERFASQLIISNEGGLALTDLRVKVELQTGTQRSVLCETTESTELESYGMTPVTTVHDIREVGVHIIVCSVHYTNPITNERKFFRKFFKFTVVNPLALKTKVTEMPEKDLYFLEAQIQNVSNTKFTLQSVRFEPAEFLIATTLAALSLKEETFNDTHNDVASISDHLKRALEISSCDFPLCLKSNDAEYQQKDLAPEGMYQFVFVLNNSSELPLKSVEENVIHLGRLDINWRAEAGQCGRLQTGMLSHTTDPSHETIGVSVRKVPPKVNVCEPLQVLVILKNNTNRDITNLCLLYDCPLEEAPIIVLLGNTRIHLGTLTSFNTTRAYLQLFPLKVGLLKPSHFWIEYEDNGGIPLRRPLCFYLSIEDLT